MLSCRNFALALGVGIALGLAGVASPASARGAIHKVEGSCLLKVGPDLMYFSGYQPSISHRKFCEDVPTTGETIFTLDYAQSEMREMKADLRIIRDVGGDTPENLQAATVAYLPPRIYPGGTLSLEHVFPETGDFIGIVTVAGPHGERWESRFPFSVGRLYSPRTPYYLMATAAALALLAMLWGKEEPRRRAQ
ncbi:hypothetical protein [Methylocystis parvus]|uniref:hypothetical protein n=1 Tax=Methylocystis parvus TaxID=134 RepID=UPI003C76CFE9